MSTVQTLINSSLRLIGVLDAGESPSTSESNDAFEALNQLLANWSAANVPVFATTRTTVAMSGAASYALATRPLKIKAAAVTNGGVSRDVEMVTAEQWVGLPDKSRAGLFAKFGWIDGSYPTATLYLLPKPATGSTLELYTVQPLTAFASLAATIDLPPGYEQALRFALAYALAPEYGAPITQGLADGASEAKAAIAKLNAEVLGSQAPAEAPQTAAA